MAPHALGRGMETIADLLPADGGLILGQGYRSRAEALAREIARQRMAEPGLEPFDPSLEFDAH
ncbi:MAG: hypothetical protein WDN06_09390, partial [Asticcacaulis sp.]